MTDKTVTETVTETVTDELREQIADVQHAIWSHWMAYMFTCGTFNEDGSWTMPAAKALRWQRQALTEYADLTEKERESDRDQADKVLNVLRGQVVFTLGPIDIPREVFDKLVGDQP